MQSGERREPDSVRFDLPASGSGLPVSRDDVLTDADWPFLDPAERPVRVRKRVYIVLFVVFTILFSLGSIQVHGSNERGFIRLERISSSHRLPFLKHRELSRMTDDELAKELGVTKDELYASEDVINRFLSRTDNMAGPLDWQIKVPVTGHTVVISYRIFLNMGISAIIALALYIRARDREGTIVFDAQNRKLRDLNGALERKIDEARQYLDELEQAQYKLVQSEKLASIGRMSATLAHEIRNPMSIIQSAAGIAQEDVPKGSPPWEAIDLIRQEVARLNGIITELLNFARPKPPHIDRHDLNSLVEAWMHALSEELAKDGVETSMALDSDLPLVKVDPDQLYQVFLNVVWNARDAMKQQTGGHVRVVTSRGNGRRVNLTIVDDGPGMDDETLRQIYEPFFTTKTHGSGLGIPVVQQLMEGMGGSATITSQLERGTTVHLEMRASRLSRKALKSPEAAAILAEEDVENTDPAFLEQQSSGEREAVAEPAAKRHVGVR